ncbi:MAG: PEP-utilizing enzyme, partial [Prochlorotrichaceae cyanobacterium]
PSSWTPLPESPHKHSHPIQGQGVSGGVQGGQVYSLQALILQSPLSPEPPIILVGQQLTPEVIPWLRRVSGLVLAQGGATSHGAILARELEIPAVVGVGSAHLEYLLSFPWLTVDGDGGIVQGLKECPPIAASPATNSLPQHQPEAPDSPEFPTLPVPLKIFATLNQLTSLNALRDNLPDGIGLLRSVWFFLDLWHGEHPHRRIAQGHHGELRTAYQKRLQQCIQAIHPRPLFYRSVDCRAAELQSLGGQETFPWTVGGSFAHCFDPSVLNLELEVLHQIDCGASDLHLVLPMVRTVEEFRGCRDHYQQFLRQQGRHQSPLPLWIMAEVPSILLQLPALAAAGVQGVVIGPGDLCQYWLGLSREQSGPLTYELDHPLVHQVILQLLRETQRLKLPTILSSHSGHIPQNYLEDYLRAGLWGITTELPHLKNLRQTIAQSWHAS